MICIIVGWTSLSSCPLSHALGKDISTPHQFEAVILKVVHGRAEVVHKGFLQIELQDKPAQTVALSHYYHFLSFSKSLTLAFEGAHGIVQSVPLERE